LWRGTPAATPPPKTGAAPGVCRRHRPESTALYEVVRDNLETRSPKEASRFGAIDDGALAFRIPRQAREELLAYLDCGLLCRGFARLKCRGCTVAGEMRDFIERTGTDELIMVSHICDHAARLRSYEIAAGIMRRSDVRLREGAIP
jgi:hypothetical protein